MPLARRASKKFKNFDIGVSYRVAEDKDYFLDCSNVVSVQGRLDTRFGTSRYNSTALPSKPLSISYFKNSSGTKYILAKCATDIYLVKESGAHTLLKSGLNASSKHRAITVNDRHIIACGVDGLFSYDGTIFTQLGQSAPTAPTISDGAGSGTLTAANYTVAFTYYSSSTGFETNIGASSNSVTISSTEVITISGTLPAVPANTTIDKVRVYLRNGTGSWLFIEEKACGAVPSVISSNSISSITPPTKNGLPPSQANFITWYNNKIVVDDGNEVVFSEPDLPDAFDDLDTATVLPIPGNGPITAIGVGFYTNSLLSAYLVICKRRSTCIFDESGNGSFVELDTKIGCVNTETMETRNGDIIFMSDSGWRFISNAQFLKNDEGQPETLAGGAIDDIFNSTGYTFELNMPESNIFHSVYLSDSKRYLTFISEGSSTELTKAYCFEFNNGGFKIWNFPASIETSAAIEDSDDRELILFGTSNGYILKHGSNISRSDVDINNIETAITAFAKCVWMGGTEDFDASYNFRSLILKAIASENNITVTAWTDYSFDYSTDTAFDVSNPNLDPTTTGFILDVSKLDEETMSDDRTPTIYSGDINRRGANICIEFRQAILNANLGLIAYQIDFSKNGNRN